jgi:hypothetical protein
LNEGFITTKNALVWLVEHLAEAEAPNCNIVLMNTKLGLAEALAADIARNQKRDTAGERTQASSTNGGAGAGAGDGGGGAVVRSDAANEVAELMRQQRTGEITREELLSALLAAL